MKIRYVLDTDAVVDVLRARHRVAEHLASLSPDDIGIATMTVAELLYGARCASNSARSELAVRRFVEVVRIVPFGKTAAGLHAEMRYATRQATVGPNDLVIAATAAAARATLVTANTREFARVPGLTIENWR